MRHAIGDYQLEQLLGAGGMKRVWRARRADGTAVALAIVLETQHARFMNEVMLAGRVRSPRVARVLDGFINDDGFGVVVSELCDGLDLDRYQQARPLAVGEAAALVAQMAEGLAAIHAARVLHRDVKPANAILTSAGVKVIDFGLSLTAVDEHTATGGPVEPAGTMAYMAPETLDRDVDARTDTYALGVSFLQLVTGRVPLAELSIHEWLGRLHARTPLPLDELHATPAVAAMIARLCDPDRDRRPYLAEILEDLHALAAAQGGALPPFVALTHEPEPEREPEPMPVQLTQLVPRADAPTLLSRDAPSVLGRRPDPIIGGPPPARAPRRALPITMYPCRYAVPDPACIVIGWPPLPLLALVPAGSGTAIHGFGLASPARALARVDDRLIGGLVADLDRDGVGELYTWSAERIHAIDAAGQLRWSQLVPGGTTAVAAHDRVPGPIVLGTHRARVLAAGDHQLDPATGALSPLTPALTRDRDHRVSATRGLDPDGAPLTLLGRGDPADDVVISAPFRGGVRGESIIAVDGTGAERWRERLPLFAPAAVAPPILVDLDGDGRPQLLWSSPGHVERRDAATGAAIVPLAGERVPVAALDLDGRGEVHLVSWTPDAIVLSRHGRCLPGVVQWLPTRGDLWRSGTLGPDGLPVGPRS